MVDPLVAFLAPLADGKPKICHRRPALRVADLWIFAEISDEDHLVDSLCHHSLTFFCLSCLLVDAPPQRA